MQDGSEMAYSICGSGDPVILLHGWACNSSFWHHQISVLAKTHQVIAIDFRGHGQSSIPQSGYTIARLTADIRELIVQLELSPAIVIGHSMGGMVAQQYAILHPEDVNRLILIATAANATGKVLISVAIADESKKTDYCQSFNTHFSHWFTSNSSPQLMSWVRDQMLQTPEEVALNLVDSYRGLDLRSRLPSINLPTLVIGARGDTSTPPTASEVIARLIPEARCIVIDGAGHFVQLERPDEVNNAIREFVSQAQV
jgi:3-oxoadipate enol-lactonase